MGAERITVDGVKVELDSVTAMEVDQVSGWLQRLEDIGAIDSDQYRAIRREFIVGRLEQMHGREGDVGRIRAAVRPDSPARPENARTFTTKRGMTVQATMTDKDALILISDAGADGNHFAADLWGKAHQPRGLSNDQWAWVHKLANEQAGKNRERDGAAIAEARTAALDVESRQVDKVLATFPTIAGPGAPSLTMHDEPLEPIKPKRAGGRKGSAKFNPKSSSNPGPGNRRNAKVS